MEFNSLGDLLYYYRKKNNLTQNDVAKKINVTAGAVSKWERDLSYPDISLFPKIANALSIPNEEFITACSKEEMPSRLIEIFQASHDIRTPINAILGYARLAAQHYDDKEKLFKCLDNIFISGEFLINVIDEVMQLASREKDTIEDEQVLSEVKNDLADNVLPSSINDFLSVYNFSNKRVLVAEDNALNREITCELLTNIGLIVENAEDGEICLKMIKDHPADYYKLIIMDIQMPNMNGYEATKAIRALKDEKKAGIPIVAMTANVYEEDRKEAYDSGMNGFTEKPIQIKRLIEEIGKYLGE